MDTLGAGSIFLIAGCSGRAKAHLLTDVLQCTQSIQGGLAVTREGGDLGVEEP